ncbi:PREDICTED: uncharacterized protein LOC108574005 [Habropoda laboriosa]|uniref:uncharacterized protein LOC108574005 n=1 Tax=Habropoda laboriosa TaxID=597456 RepID=UPI00083DF03C|nr:PREDICTED: uncharacterized protein LOC108574005 [Habropoda laboriosa]
MELNKEETIKLIEVYRKWVLIWDPKHPDHYNKVRKEDAWEEIGREIGKSPEQCKKKMEYLLAALRREKMKMKKSTGAHQVYKSSWFAFNSMRFLWDKNKPRPTLNIIQTTESEEMEKLEEVVMGGGERISSLATPEKEYTSGPSTSTQYPEQPSPKVKKLKTSKNQRLNKAFEILVASANQCTDESYHFGNFVASKLRTFDENVRCAVQNDILNLFLRASTGYYNNSNPYPTHIFENPHTAHPPRYPSTSFASTEFSSSLLNSQKLRTHSPEVHPSPTSPSSSTSSTFSNDFIIQDLI